MRLELRVFGSSTDGSDVFTIGALQVSSNNLLIGRDEECHYRPNSTQVSRHHCVIIRDEYSVRIRDLGSSNGTFVNSCRVRGDVVLINGDIIQVGDVQLQVEIHTPNASPPSQGDTELGFDLSEQPDASNPTLDSP